MQLRQPLFFLRHRDMTSLRDRVLIAAGVIFVLGSGYIVYSGRPVMDIPAPATGSQGAATEYAIADLQAHATADSCWTAIDGGVYDLTEWINRHPGGPSPIVGLCGIDGTEAFTAMHGGSKAAKTSLGLLKIGVLK